MERDRWQEARTLFDTAAALPPDDREAWVAARTVDDPELRAEVLSLLASLADAGRFLDGTRVPGPATDATTAPPARERIGPWRLVATLGHGGMGTVHLGERSTGDFAQRVAIKVVSGGAANAAIRRRFETERRLLASLEHPGIARLLDGGTTEDGLPYFVMEHVEGESLLAHADRQGLDLQARIALFLEVCAAVEHAHQRLVLHRDLKPANILVDREGRPKLLDFGIGKLLQPDATDAVDATATLERWLTPSYASPEQLRGQASTTATDVYGLGVVLFELLTGCRPYRPRERTTRGIESAILEQPARRASSVATQVEATANDEATGPESLPAARAARRATNPQRLRRELRGDLDTILERALAKEPERRFASVGELAGDLRRHLRGEPVLARPATFGYRLRKLVRRHRFGFAAAAAMLALVAALTAISALRLRQERDRARGESERARAVTTLLSQLFAGADPNRTRGATLTLRDFLSEAPTRAAAIDDRRVRSDVLHIVGDALLRSGAERAAIEPLTAALTLRRQVLGGRHVDTARTMTVLGAARGQIGEKPQGRVLLRGGIAILEDRLGPMAADLVWPLDRLSLLTYEHDAAGAVALVERALHLHFWNGTPLADRAFLYQHLAVYVRAGGEDRRGAALYLRAYDVASRTLGEGSAIAAASLCNAARAYNDLGESRRALGMQQRALAGFERAWAGADNVQLAGCLRTGAEILVQLGEADAARALGERAWAMNRRLYGDDHMQTMNMLALTAWVADAQGHLDEANALCARWLDFLRAQNIPEDNGWATSYVIQARYKLANGDRAGAEAQARSTLALLRRELAPGEPALVPALVLLGEIVTPRDREEAGQLLREADAIARTRLSPEQRYHRTATAALTRFEAEATR